MSRCVLAGTTLIREFPDAPETLEAKVQEQPRVAKASVHLPEDYRDDRTYPLLVFLNGGGGGDGGNPGEARRICGPKGVVCANFPLFKSRLAKAAKDSPRYWSRMYLRDVDAAVMWRGYAPMFAWLEALVPNLDPARRGFGGFSNGAHTAVALLNRRSRDLLAHVTHILLIEGGRDLKAGRQLKGLPILLLQGKKWDQPWLEPARKAASTSKAALTWGLMAGVGHGISDVGRRRMRRWLLTTPARGSLA